MNRRLCKLTAHKLNFHVTLFAVLHQRLHTSCHLTTSDLTCVCNPCPFLSLCAAGRTSAPCLTQYVHVCRRCCGRTSSSLSTCQQCSCRCVCGRTCSGCAIYLVLGAVCVLTSTMIPVWLQLHDSEREIYWSFCEEIDTTLILEACEIPMQVPVTFIVSCRVVMPVYSKE